MFEKILERIKEYSTIIIHRHEKPDGDAIGSQMGLRHIILEAFPDKRVYTVGDESRFSSLVDDAVMHEIADDVYNGALAVILDCGSSHLICDKRYMLAAHSVRIDHHLYCEKIAHDEVIDSSFESCCGMVAQFAVESGLKINSEAANALFLGLVTDTGRFRYDSTDERTFAIASELMKSGVDTSSLYRKLYADTFESKKLRAEFTMKIRFTPNGAAYIYTTKQELSELGIDAFFASRGMVGVMADTKDVSVWANFTESDEGILCELRSDILSVNQIAVKYGGGGHKKASGATLDGYETMQAMLLDLDALAAEAKSVQE